MTYIQEPKHLMFRDKIISELERFIQFSKDTNLTKYKNNEEDYAASGHPIESYLSHPRGTPGVHLYWDSDIESIQTAQLLLEYFKDWVDIQRDAFPRLPFENYIKTKINTMNYILLNPQFENLLVGETNRGVELVLLLAINENWKHIQCWDERGAYGKLIKDFFKDERIVWNKQVTCHYDFNLLQDDNYIMVLNHSLGWGSKHWVPCPKVKMIIKDGIIVDPNKHWKEHVSEEKFCKVFDELQKEIEENYGQRIFDYRTE